MTSLGALRRYAGSRRPVEPSCELCAEPLPENHGHVVDLEQRRLCCTCRACSLSLRGHASGRFRGVPERVRRTPGFSLSDADWQALGVPVGLAFVMRSSHNGTWNAVLPSPAGAVEAELSSETWASVVENWPFLSAIEPDVEGLLIHRERSGAFEAWVTPVDACYRLVALVRRHWRGFDGGDAGREELARFFAGLRETAEALP